MLQELKRKSLKATLFPLVLLGGVLAALLAIFGSDFALLLKGPTAFDPLDSNNVSHLEGSYLEANITTLIDYYAQTISNSSKSGEFRKVTSREYLMPVVTDEGSTIYIGVEVPSDKVEDADAVVDDTIRMLDDTDGSYEWDGSYVTVRGTVRAMDEETEQLYRDYFTGTSVSSSDIGLDDSCSFKTLVLVDGTVGELKKDNLLFFVFLCVLLAVAFVWVLFNQLTGRYQKQVKTYIAAQPDPQAAEQQLELLYQDTADMGSVRHNSHWLMSTAALDPWVLAADDVVWAHQYLVRRKQGLITVGKSYSVKVYSATEDAKHHCHTIQAKNEAEAQELLAMIQREYPAAVIGYTDELFRAYAADPAAFHRNAVEAQRRAAESGTMAPVQDAQPNV